MKHIFRTALALFLALSLLCGGVYAEELAEAIAAEEIEVIGVENVEDAALEAADWSLGDAPEPIEETEPEAAPEAEQAATEETEAVTGEVPAEEQPVGEQPAKETPAEEQPSEEQSTEEAPAEVVMELTEDDEEAFAEDDFMPEPLVDGVAIIEDADSSAKLMAASVNGVPAVNGILTVWNKAVVAMNKGDAVQLVVDGQTIKSCKSSKKKVASVTKAGWLTAKKAGKTKLTIKLKGKKKPIKVTVKVTDPWKATAVYLDRAGTVTIGKGQTLQLNAAMTTLSGEPSTSTLKWKSSKKKVATVNKYGLVKGKKKGKTKITVTTSSGKKASVTIKVVKAWQDLGDGAVQSTREIPDEGGIWRDDLVQRAVEITNEKRVAEGHAPLAVDEDLMAGARIRVEEASRCFSHTRPDGSKCTSVSGKAHGENLCFVIGGDDQDAYYLYEDIRTYEDVKDHVASPKKAVNAWMGSEGHHENMMKDKYTLIGIGCYQTWKPFGGGHTDGHTNLFRVTTYWVQLFGYENTTQTTTSGQSTSTPSTSETTTTSPTDNFTVLSDGTKVYPDGHKEYTDGTIEYASGTKKLPDGTTEYPDGSKVLPDGTNVWADGTKIWPDGTTEYTSGRIKYADGREKFVNGVVLKRGEYVESPSGTRITPDGISKGSAYRDEYKDGSFFYIYDGDELIADIYIYGEDKGYVSVYDGTGSGTVGADFRIKDWTMPTES